MITGAIALFLLIAVVPPAISNGDSGALWLVIIFAAILLFLGAVSRTSDRADMNRMKYWAMDGKDRAAVTRSTEPEILMTNNKRRREHAFTCPGCKKYICVTSVETIDHGARVRRCACPVCQATINFPV